MPDDALAGQVALVTGAGASDGIGCAVARALAARGAAVGITATTERIHERAAQLEAAGATAWAGTADLVDETAAERLVEAVLERFGRLDVLVNNAGMTQTGGEEISAPFAEMDARAWRLAAQPRPSRAQQHRQAGQPGAPRLRLGHALRSREIDRQQAAGGKQVRVFEQVGRLSDRREGQA